MRQDPRPAEAGPRRVQPRGDFYRAAEGAPPSVRPLVRAAAERLAALEAENRVLRAAVAAERSQAARRKGAEDICRSLAASVAALTERLQRSGAGESKLQAALTALQAQARSLGEAVAQLSRSNADLEGEVAARSAELTSANAALRDSAEHLRLVFASATEYAIYTSDLAGRITSWNTGAQRIFGYAEAEILGRPVDFLFTEEDRAARVPELGMCQAVEEGRAEANRWLLRKDGSRFWTMGMKMPLLDAEGRPQGFLFILRDKTEAHAEDERRSLMLREMNHRIKNTLAVVYSMAVQTERTAATPAAFRRAFGQRLVALARAHDMLARSGWDGAPLREVVERTLEPHVGGGAGRLVIEGPPIRLPPHAAVTVHLAFHELATNAAKHGALSVPEGRVQVIWSLERGSRHRSPVAEILWRERGGPAVRPPDRSGFGLRLLRRGLAREFGAEVGLGFAREGVECRIRLALAAPAATGAGGPR
ncbi:MAG: PAS domain S-box protein [Acetobacteraceae bacterium]|nr:PAS domain S-box protein [Acetobacteraceae bacterium]